MIVIIVMINRAVIIIMVICFVNIIMEVVLFVVLYGAVAIVIGSIYIISVGVFFWLLVSLGDREAVYINSVIIPEEKVIIMMNGSHLEDVVL